MKMKTAKPPSRVYLAKFTWMTVIGLVLAGCIPVSALTPTLAPAETHTPALTVTSQPVDGSLPAFTPLSSDIPPQTVTNTLAPLTPTQSPSPGSPDKSPSGDTPETTQSPALTETPVPTETLESANLEVTTETPVATAPLVATATSPPTERPTPTSAPTLRPTPTTAPESEEDNAPQQIVDCSDSSGGRQKIRVENQTGAEATLFLSGPENYACTISPGIQRIYILSGTYEISGLVCGGNYYSMGTHVVNPTWYISLQCP
jgi:hypothetical protein